MMSDVDINNEDDDGDDDCFLVTCTYRIAVAVLPEQVFGAI